MVKKFKEFFEETPEVVKGAPGEDVVPEPEISEEIPAIFATIHYRSEDRPDGYTPEDLAEINERLNKKAK